MGVSDRDYFEKIAQEITKEKCLPLTDDIYIAILAGYTRGFSDAADKTIMRLNKAIEVLEKGECDVK